MSRLIDADVVIMNLLKEAAHQAVINHPENARGLKYAAEYMKELPTVYDVDKVVEQLENLKDCGQVSNDKCDTYAVGQCHDCIIDRVKILMKGAVKDE